MRAPPPDSVNQAGCQCEEPVLLTYVARRLYVFRPGYAIQYACGRGMAMRTRYARACMGGMWAAGRGRRRVHMRYTALQTARQTARQFHDNAPPPFSQVSVPPRAHFERWNMRKGKEFLTTRRLHGTKHIARVLAADRAAQGQYEASGCNKNAWRPLRDFVFPLRVLHGMQGSPGFGRPPPGLIGDFEVMLCVGDNGFMDASHVALGFVWRRTWAFF